MFGGRHRFRGDVHPTRLKFDRIHSSVFGMDLTEVLRCDRENSLKAFRCDRTSQPIGGDRAACAEIITGGLRFRASRFARRVVAVSCLGSVGGLVPDRAVVSRAGHYVCVRCSDIASEDVFIRFSGAVSGGLHISV